MPAIFGDFPNVAEEYNSKQVLSSDTIRIVGSQNLLGGIDSMKRSFLISLLACVVILSGVVRAATGNNGDERDPVEAAIASYVDAWNSQDRKCSPDGVHASRLSGGQVIGREASQREFSVRFEEVEDAQLVVSTASIDFLSPSVALKLGVAVVTQGENAPATLTCFCMFQNTFDQNKGVTS